MDAEQQVVVKHLESAGLKPGLVQTAVAAGLDWGTFLQVVLSLPWGQIVTWLENFIKGLNPPAPQPPKP